MTIIQDFQALQTGEQIGLVLAIASVILIGLHWAWAEFIAYCDRQPIYDPLVHGPEDQQEIAAKHVVKVERKRRSIEDSLRAGYFLGDAANMDAADDLLGMMKRDRFASRASQRASSQLIGGFLLIEDPSLPPNSVRLVYPSKARYPVFPEVNEAHRHHQEGFEAEIQRMMAADTIKGKRP